MEYTDFVVTGRPQDLEALGDTFNFKPIDGTFDEKKRQTTIRVFGDPGFFLFGFERQGYGRIVERVIK